VDTRRKRLEALLELIPPGSRVADVGTDRGLLPRVLLVSGLASHCIATERDPTRLARARCFPAGHRLQARLELRAGNGLEPLGAEDRLDVVVIAGLGGGSIVRILGCPRRAALGVRRFVLQPRTDAARVRRWLLDEGFGIVDERLGIERRRFFLALAASPGTEGSPLPAPPAPLSTEDLLEVGPRLAVSGDPLVAEFWARQLERAERILAAGAGGRGGREAERIRDLALRVRAADAATRPRAGSARPAPWRPEGSRS
jgi:tRNA (adenine22-N1)-methyltransferase